eukprot:8440850-Heterocapsa_arctica.AAC.1
MSCRLLWEAAAPRSHSRCAASTAMPRRARCRSDVAAVVDQFPDELLDKLLDELLDPQRPRSCRL